MSLSVYDILCIKRLEEINRKNNIDNTIKKLDSKIPFITWKECFDFIICLKDNKNYSNDFNILCLKLFNNKPVFEKESDKITYKANLMFLKAFIKEEIEERKTNNKESLKQLVKISDKKIINF